MNTNIMYWGYYITELSDCDLTTDLYVSHIHQ